jgi:hypothetical protein
MNGRKRLGYNLDMGFVIVPPNQPRVPVRITAYPDESDPGPYPIPGNAPLEGWPLQPPGSVLDQVQRAGEGDRHVLVLDPYGMKIYELFRAFKRDAGWEADQVSVFDLTSNKLRPDGWTSADAAGLPILPAAVRFEECERGMVNHALRVTARRTRRAYFPPATHFASRLTDPNLPAMGERLRLRPDFDIRGYSPHAQAVLKGLKKHGMFVADNGMDWLISVTPDERFRGLEDLLRVKPDDFEVVAPTDSQTGWR